MNNPPLFPSFQYFWNQLKSRLTGHIDQPSVLDLMPASQKALLTDKAKEVLAKVPSYKFDPTGQSVANFISNGLPSWIYGGQVQTSPIVRTPEGPFYSTPGMTNISVNHEALHALDKNMGIVNSPEWKKALSQLSPESRAELLRRGRWGVGSTTGMSNHIQDPTEAFAYAGMYGYENVPPELKEVFKKVMTPVQGPPEQNPSQSARRTFDRTRIPYGRER